MRNYYIVEFVNIKSGMIACEQPAKDLPELTCNLFPLDRYKMILIWHNTQSLVCGISINHDGEPTTDELTQKCGTDVMHKYKTGQLVLRYFGTHQPQPSTKVVINPPALSPSDLGDISTSKDYQVLAYDLNWYGIADPLHLWQNQWDDEIMKVANETNVPPRLIKSIIGQESQFWPLWSGKGEVGLIQLTDDGADLVMSWNAGLFAIHCPRAILPSRCNNGYSLLDPQEEKMVRDEFRSSLILRGTPQQAAQKIQGDLIIYAEILENYYEASAEAVAPIAPTWDYAIAAYNSGMECILFGEICSQGKIYLDEVMK
jgi:hypothetical protein